MRCTPGSGAVQGEPFLPGPALASPYHLAGDPEGAPIGYNRDGNPTWARYEAALGELEGGEVVLFSSGMAAVTAVMLPVLDRPGAVVVPADGYPGARGIAREQLGPRGVETRIVATDRDALHAALDGAALVLVETPANPRLDVIDVAALCEAAHAAGALVAVDNTLATPLGQLPLDLGADISVTSASKAVTGHSDLTMGYVATRDPERAAALRAWRTLTGAVPGPVRGVARPSLAGHAAPAPRSRLRERARARGALRGASRRARGPLSGPARRSGPRGRAPPDAPLRAGARPDPGERGARPALPGRRRARDRGDELRRHPHHRGAPRALGHRRRPGGLHPLLRRLRGHARLLADVQRALGA